MKFALVHSSYDSYETLGYLEDGVIPNCSCKVIYLQGQ